MKCRLNLCLLIAVVFILATGYVAAQTSLMEAAEKGDTDILQALLAKGADVNAKDKIGHTALMIAKVCGHKEIVRILKEAGAKE